MYKKITNAAEVKAIEEINKINIKPNNCKSKAIQPHIKPALAILSPLYVSWSVFNFRNIFLPKNIATSPSKGNINKASNPLIKLIIA